MEVTAFFTSVSVTKRSPAKCFKGLKETKRCLNCREGGPYHASRHTLISNNCGWQYGSQRSPSVWAWRRFTTDADVNQAVTSYLQTQHRHASHGETVRLTLKRRWWLSGGLVSTISYFRAKHSLKLEYSY